MVILSPITLIFSLLLFLFFLFIHFYLFIYFLLLIFFSELKAALFRQKIDFVLDLTHRGGIG